MADIITSKKNASATALFYSLINSAVSYDPIGWGMPYVTHFIRLHCARFKTNADVHSCRHRHRRKRS